MEKQGEKEQYSYSTRKYVSGNARGQMAKIPKANALNAHKKAAVTDRL